MPRYSARAEQINILTRSLEEWNEIRLAMELDTSDSDDDHDDQDLRDIPDLTDLEFVDDDSSSSDSEPEAIRIIKSKLSSILGNRYLNRGPYRLADQGWYIYAFTTLTPRRFRNAFRMNRRTFSHLFDAIKDHPVFQTAGRRPQKDPKLQLLVALYHFGGGANSGSRDRIAPQFGVSEGSVGNYIARVITALLSFKKRPPSVSKTSHRRAYTDPATSYVFVRPSQLLGIRRWVPNSSDTKAGS